MRKLVILPLVCLTGLLALTQPPAQATSQTAGQTLASDAPSREDVLKLFELLQVKKLTEVVMQSARQQAQSMVEEMVRESMPDPTPEQRRLVDDLTQRTMEDVLRSFPIDEMLNAMVPVYQRHLTKSDLQAITAFYSSPVGQKMLREQPQMVQESMQALAPIQERMMQDMMTNLKDRVQRSIEQEQKKAKDKAKSGKS